MEGHKLFFAILPKKVKSKKKKKKKKRSQERKSTRGGGGGILDDGPYCLMHFLKNYSVMFNRYYSCIERGVWGPPPENFYSYKYKRSMRQFNTISAYLTPSLFRIKPTVFSVVQTLL